MDMVVREGLEVDLLPTEELRRVYLFALDYYFRSGQTKAPSVAVLQTEYGDALEDNEINMEEEPDESVEWALDDLKGTYLYNAVGNFNKRFVSSMAKTDSSERATVIDAYCGELVGMAMRVQRRDQFVHVHDGSMRTLAAYDERKASQSAIRGMTFGLPMIDAYTHGIHDSELAVLAAGPKVGKSYFLCMAALHQWREGKSVAFFSLENPIQTMLDRIACLATGVPSRKWQHGQCSPEEEDRVVTWVEEVQRSSNPLWICQPDLGRRSFEAMVHDAQVRDSNVVLVDQLTYVELADPRKPKHERIGDALHRLHDMLGSGRSRMPCLLAHQINREGVKAAAKLGYLQMEHLADSAEVERTADWVFGLYRSQEERVTERAKFQTLAARRDDPKHFQMIWNIDASFVAVQQEIQLG
jgi:replicative DNA helicase